MRLSSKLNNEKIKEMKRIFDRNDIDRSTLEDEFFLELINVIESKAISLNESSNATKVTIENQNNIEAIKMELMVNIEGITNEMKGKTKSDRYSFGLDSRKLALSVFLAEANVLMRNRDFTKSDVIIFYDDTPLKTGNRGFGITRDEIFTNVSGTFKVFRFNLMERIPEFILGLKKDVFRVHLDNTSYDIKVRKDIVNTTSVFDVMTLLYRYAQECKNEK